MSGNFKSDWMTKTNLDSLDDEIKYTLILLCMAKYHGDCVPIDYIFKWIANFDSSTMKSAIADFNKERGTSYELRKKRTSQTPYNEKDLPLDEYGYYAV